MAGTFALNDRSRCGSLLSSAQSWAIAILAAPRFIGVLLKRVLQGQSLAFLSIFFPRRRIRIIILSPVASCRACGDVTYLLAPERCQRGRLGLPAKQFRGLKPPTRVRIPPSPPFACHVAFGPVATRSSILKRTPLFDIRCQPKPGSGGGWDLCPECN